MGSTMTIGQEMDLGWMTTGLGLLVVFAALALIIVIIYLLSYILRDRKKDAPAKAAPVAPAPAAPAPPVPQAAQADDSELVAVLTAAVAYAMTGDAVNTTGLVVRSYRRIDNESAWGKAGRNSQIFNKF